MARVKMTVDRMQELGITMADVNKFRNERANLRRCGRDGGSKYTSKEPNWYDDYEETAKWKREIEAKEAKKKQRAAKKKGHESVSDKRKAPTEVDPDSSPESSRKHKKAKAEMKKQGKRKVVVSDSSSSDDKGWKPTEAGTESSDTDNDEDDNAGVHKVRAKLYQKLREKQRVNVIPEAKADFNQSKLEDYDIRLVGRSLCKMSRIRMDSFEQDFPFGLDKILRPFRGLLELSLPYCESVVKVFYSNLKISRGGVVSTCVRGQTIEVNEKKLLQWLNVKAPQLKDTTFSGDEMDKILLEGGTTEDDTHLYRPKQLPHKYRVLHYLYSRNFVNKGKHYTTMSIEDKQILTCLIRRKPFNMGRRIVDTMLRAAALGKKNSELPYPSIVSLILDKKKIWYLQEGEPPIWSPEFDEESLHRMQIPFPPKEASIHSSSEGEQQIKSKTEPTAPPSGPTAPPHSVEEGAAELGRLFGQVLDDKLGLMQGQLQAHLDALELRVESRLSQIALDFKNLRDFIYLYATEFREFASFKASKDQCAGPSTKSGEDPHEHAVDKLDQSLKRSPEPSHPTPTTNLAADLNGDNATSPEPACKTDEEVHEFTTCEQALDDMEAQVTEGLTAEQGREAEHLPEATSIEKTPQYADGCGDNVTEGPTTEKEMEEDDSGGDNVSEGPSTQKHMEDEDAVRGNATEGPTTENQSGEEFDPITPLSIVPLPEPVNPPPAPYRKIAQPVPLRFIPASSFSVGAAAENLPHIFSAATQFPPPPPRPATPMFIPVDLPGSHTSSPRRATPRKSPSKRKKKN